MKFNGHAIRAYIYGAVLICSGCMYSAGNSLLDDSGVRPCPMCRCANIMIPRIEMKGPLTLDSAVYCILRSVPDDNADISVSFSGALGDKVVNGFLLRQRSVLEVFRLLCDCNGLMLLSNGDELFIIEKDPLFISAEGPNGNE